MTEETNNPNESDQLDNPLFLHEEILLLALKEEEGTFVSGPMYTYAIAGAITSELLLTQRIALDENSKSKDVVVVLSTEPTGEDVLDHCLRKIDQSKRPKKLQSWISIIGNYPELKHDIANRMDELGVLKATTDKVLLIFTRRIYPEVDPIPEQQLRKRISRAIFEHDESVLDAHTSILIALLNQSGLLRSLFDRKMLKAEKAWIDQICSGDLIGDATKDAIQAAQAAMMAAVMVPIIATTVIS